MSETVDLTSATQAIAVVNEIAALAGKNPTHRIVFDVDTLDALFFHCYQAGLEVKARSPREADVIIKEMGRDAQGNLERVVEWKATAEIVPLADGRAR